MFTATQALALIDREEAAEARGRRAASAEWAERLERNAKAACGCDKLGPLPTRYGGHLPGETCSALAEWAREMRQELKEDDR